MGVVSATLYILCYLEQIRDLETSCVWSYMIFPHKSTGCMGLINEDSSRQKMTRVMSKSVSLYV